MDIIVPVGFPNGSGVRNPPANAGDVGTISGSGPPLGEGNGNPLQYSYLKNSMDKRSLVDYSLSQRDEHDRARTGRYHVLTAS